MRYQDFSVQAFIEDDYFRRWVYQPDQVSDRFWKNWLAEHPEKQTEVAEARSVLLAIQFKEYSVSTEEKDQIWHQIRQQRSLPIPATTSQSSSIGRAWRWTTGIAASLALIVVAYLWWERSAETVYTVEYGTTRTILLSDQSTVELNANSTLRVSHHWNEKREVWLEGEAFFDIHHHEGTSGQRIPFIVHTSELAVRVVGTEFNVLSRRGETQVGLHSGKVKLSLDEDVSEVEMQPGDWVTFSKEGQQLTKDHLIPASYTAWRNQRFWFDNHSLSDIAMMIEDYYGLEVNISSAALSQRTFSGQFPADRLDLMLTAIEVTLSVRLTRTGQSINIAEKEE
ncbi:FecR domain-containing protein [Tunicatimonas pelagia]|uniref:FecR domain-containing protein n=1 Tax=Tunicatimonas pelagia TaxID=931531 RepID=UPI002666C894|nr:FecR domain-containing protein [Tunicatimonas pelagia]WKN45431.1 FecR domain-containing protein [Tunicatimonas pelagia]